MSKLQKHRVRRYHRAEFAREVQVFLDSDTTAHGLTRDLTPESVSIFLSLKGAQSFLKGVIGSDGQAKLSEVRKKLVDQIILISIGDAHVSEPLDLRVLRVDPSWQKGYDLFIAGRFQNLNDFQIKELEKACPSVLVRQSSDAPYRSSSLPIFRKKLEIGESEKVQLQYSNSYPNVRSTRDFVAGLAGYHGFSEEEVYQIKLISDELLMNAFLYGSREDDLNNTNLNLTFGPEGMVFEVIDHAGAHFNDRPYHLRRDVRSGPVGGLALVEAYSDDWQVEINNGNFTKVTYFKSKTGPEENGEASA
jgi:anti-sigma regulatory factor (Ser/Thr protein kinase)